LSVKTGGGKTRRKRSGRMESVEKKQKTKSNKMIKREKKQTLLTPSKGRERKKNGDKTKKREGMGRCISGGGGGDFESYRSPKKVKLR